MYKQRSGRKTDRETKDCTTRGGRDDDEVEVGGWEEKREGRKKVEGRRRRIDPAGRGGSKSGGSGRVCVCVSVQVCVYLG